MLPWFTPLLSWYLYLSIVFVIYVFHLYILSCMPPLLALLQILHHWVLFHWGANDRGILVRCMLYESLHDGPFSQFFFTFLRLGWSPCSSVILSLSLLLIFAHTSAFLVRVCYPPPFKNSVWYCFSHPHTYVGLVPMTFMYLVMYVPSY